jgi:hypothetical protein
VIVYAEGCLQQQMWFNAKGKGSNQVLISIKAQEKKNSWEKKTDA